MVLCVDGTSHEPGKQPLDPVERLTTGAVYQVERIGIEDTLILVGYYRSAATQRQLGVDFGYRLWRFVPAGKRGDFADLLTAKPVRVGEDA